MTGDTLHDLVDAEARHDYDPERDPSRPTRAEANADQELSPVPPSRGSIIDGYERVVNR